MKTPQFIFYKEILRSNYKEFDALCKKYLGNHKIVYSVKTNPFPGVIKTLLKEGSGFEAASLDEINLVKRSRGLKILNGPAKTEQELRIAIKSKFLINVDSKSEIEKISKIIRGRPLNIGLRVALTESKFGISVEKVKEIIRYADSKNLKVISLHL
ncbi:MAG: alanine racemase, partial [archaeon]